MWLVQHQAQYRIVITAVIETKGCWKPQLFTALETQLYRDYMLRLQAPVGIYLVGWFDKPKWDPMYAAGIGRVAPCGTQKNGLTRRPTLYRPDFLSRSLF